MDILLPVWAIWTILVMLWYSEEIHDRLLAERDYRFLIRLLIVYLLMPPAALVGAALTLIACAINLECAEPVERYYKAMDKILG